MELSVSHQLFQLLCSVTVGAAAGFFYDVLRVLRRRLNASAVFDGIFWLVIFVVLFTLGMDIGDGSLHIFMLIFTVLGFGIYMLILSRAVLKLLNKAADLVEILLSPLKKLVKKLLQAARIFVSKIKSKLKMIKKPKRKKRRKSSEENENNGDATGGAHSVLYPEPRRRTERP